MAYQKNFFFDTKGRGTYEITNEVNRAIREAGVETGICHVFTHHTSASLTLCENADADVRRDLESFMARLVPDGDRIFSHTLEGPDDMAAHVRSILTKMDLSIPVTCGRGALGTWQGIFLWEHRTRPHRRNISVTIVGD
jgi:secondary thiamine-phosphate synthase enzyme